MWVSFFFFLVFFFSRFVLFLARLVSNWSESVFFLVFLVLDLWMFFMSIFLFLNELFLIFMYMLWYMCLSIFLVSRYLRSSRFSTRIFFIYSILVGSLVFLVFLRFFMSMSD